MSKKRNGILIAFEGISASGKGTQIELLIQKLKEKNINYIITHWKEDEIVSPFIQEVKKQRMFTPLTWSLLHATDFYRRYTEVILPSLKKGYVVIADRYHLTPLTRDSVRGINLDYIQNIYSLAIKPDITFYMDLPSDLALERRLNRYPKLHHYSSGKDIFIEESLPISFFKYQSLLRNKYLQLINENIMSENIITVNSKNSPTEIHKEIWNTTKDLFQINN